MKTFALILASLLSMACAHAQTQGILEGNTLKTVTLQESLQKVTPGSIVIIGENHGFQVHRDQHLEILESLRSQGFKVSVGMEFFTYTQQNFVESYRSGELSEADFLKAISWTGVSYDFYRSQAEFPRLVEGSKTLALNAPRTLTGKAAKEGLKGFNDEDWKLMPPQFSVGRDSYKQRFLGMMPHLPSPEAGERYFLAQSIWDDTMAWNATEFVLSHPDQVLVIIVGEFHVQYGGGLPNRIHARSANVPVLTFSQVNTLDLSQEDIAEAVKVSPLEGPRADYLWLAPAVQGK